MWWCVLISPGVTRQPAASSTTSAPGRRRRPADAADEPVGDRDPAPGELAPLVVDGRDELRPADHEGRPSFRPASRRSPRPRSPPSTRGRAAPSRRASCSLGGCPANSSPCTAPISSKSVRLDEEDAACARRLASVAPASRSAASMISKHRRACTVGLGIDLSVGHCGAVPATKMRSPTRTALL